ncbi:mechanosensitive ion channel family protein [Patescibacteria group bacterium]|nr:mechanosensitive ion channel family protein [Patescibacteria group bacterium]
MNIPRLFSEIPSGPLKAVLILVASYLVALIIRFIFENILQNLSRKTKTKLDDKIIVVSKTPIFWTVFLLGFFYAATSLDLSANIQKILTNLLKSVALIIWARASLKILHIVSSELEKRLDKIGKSSDAVPFLENLAKVTLFAITALIFLTTWGVNVTPLLASAGVAGLAVAFAAKDTVANLFGGISVFFDKPYKVGDYVIVDDKYRGEVIQIGMRSTKIRTRDNVLLTAPNSVMVTNVVINETGFDPKLRIRIPLGVSYNEDLDNVEKVLVDELKKHPRVLASPAPRVRFRAFGDSAVELEVLGVIKTPPERGVTIHELIKEIHRRFKKEGIKIPYPHREVYLHNE